MHMAKIYMHMVMLYKRYVCLRTTDSMKKSQTLKWKRLRVDHLPTPYLTADNLEWISWNFLSLSFLSNLEIMIPSFQCCCEDESRCKVKYLETGDAEKMSVLSPMLDRNGCAYLGSLGWINTVFNSLNSKRTI